MNQRRMLLPGRSDCLQRNAENKGCRGLRWWTQILSLANYPLQLSFAARLRRTLISHMQSPGSFPPARISLDRWCKHKFVPWISPVCWKGSFSHRKPGIKICFFPSHLNPLWSDRCFWSRLSCSLFFYTVSYVEDSKRFLMHSCSCWDLWHEYMSHYICSSVYMCLWTWSSTGWMVFIVFHIHLSHLSFTSFNILSCRAFFFCFLCDLIR